MNDGNGDDLAEAVRRAAVPGDIPENATILKPLTDDLPGSIEALLSGKLKGVATGFPRTDRVTGGLRNMAILAGTTGVGKSTWALGVALNVSGRGGAIIYYSLEMSRLEMVRRALLACAKETCTWDALRQHPQVLGHTQETLTKAARALYLWDHTIRPMEIEKHIELMRARSGGAAPLVIIDHQRLVEPDASESRTYQNALTRQEDLLTDIMRLTRETGAPVLLISELRKEDLDDPSLGAVKGSVSAIYNAQMVLALQPEHKPEKDELPEESEQVTLDNLEAPKRVRLYVLKNRDGRSGLYIPYWFDGAASRYTEEPERKPVA